MCRSGIYPWIILILYSGFNSPRLERIINAIKYIEAVSAGTGAFDGATVTSGTAMNAADARKITGHMLDTGGAFIAHVGCEAAAVIGLSTVAAGSSCRLIELLYLQGRQGMREKSA